MNKILFLILSILSLNVSSQLSGSLLFGGETRNFIYYIPQTLPPQAPMLVLVLHGATQDGPAIANVSNMHQFTNSANAVVVYPDGISNSWNVGLSVGGSTADDLGFLDALIDYFIDEVGVDPQKIFSCGFSNGGYMSYKLACESSHCISAVASVAGVMTQGMIDSCGEPDETSIMHIHGTSDFIVSYNGSSFSGLSVQSVIDHWNNANSCSNESSVIDIPNTSLTDFSTVEKTTWSDCQNNSEVILYRIDGGGHQWPDTDALLGGVGAINRDINASEEIISFFQSHSCSSIQKTNEEDPWSFTIYPNPATDVIHLSLPNNHSVQIEIKDLVGKTVFSKESRSSLAVNCQDWATGIYVIYCSNEVKKFYKH